MGSLFVPYNNDLPATVELKGHKLLILTCEAGDLRRDLSKLGGDSIRELNLFNESPMESQIVANLAASVKGGVVIAPPGVRASQMLENLERELPWMQ